ncbi:hypothetical protein OIU34_23395 [Pararhizobium sp. BT-229]|uniref:hypothetical protein n=1 Tax=Pararhizobium sp. BT-229 TaxID=2986923 RepID=UPI0021F6AEDA|nr:hypothetical protein [Pararhizobium sp. BT-229]MCV9964842.1 hypothetical protein [Pararhizobium sp. BT-229]
MYALSSFHGLSTRHQGRCEDFVYLACNLWALGEILQRFLGAKVLDGRSAQKGAEGKMIRNFLFAAAIYAITLGGLVWYNYEPDQLTESERLAARHEMKDEYKAAIRDQLERYRTGRLTKEEKAEVAAAQEKFLRVFENSMKDLTVQIDQTITDTSDNDENFP